MKIKTNLGIVSYGVYLPSFVVDGLEIESAQKKEPGGLTKPLGVSQKTIADFDEDVVSMSTEAVFQALRRWSGNSNDIGALFIGSESHPYAVKPSGTVVAEALGLNQDLSVADMQFACKAGSQAIQVCAGFVGSDLMQNALAVGADTAQSRPGDALELTAASGAAAYLIGREKILAKLLATHSVVSDTPDFWRRPRQSYPEHGGRFTGGPAYFHHVLEASKKLMAETNLTPKDISHCVFHTPNAKFPIDAAKQLGFSNEQLDAGLVVRSLGNTYAAASLLALAAVLDKAKSGELILVTSYGSGAGSDSFLFEVTKELENSRSKWNDSVLEQLNKAKKISYQDYLEKSKSH